MLSFTDKDPKRDLANLVIVKLKNNKIKIRQGGPHAWWYFRPDSGKLPAQYRGEFTSLDQALNAVRSFCGKQNWEILSIEYTEEAQKE